MPRARAIINFARSCYSYLFLSATLTASTEVNSDDVGSEPSHEWRLLHSLAMMCSTVYKSSSAIKEVYFLVLLCIRIYLLTYSFTSTNGNNVQIYGKGAIVMKPVGGLRSFIVHNEVYLIQSLHTP